MSFAKGRGGHRLCKEALAMFSCTLDEIFTANNVLVTICMIVLRVVISVNNSIVSRIAV